MTWKQKFIQQGMRGTAIVFGNGSVDDAMRSFPPTANVVQDTSVAVFAGPEKPTPEEERVLQGTTDEDRRRQEEMARENLNHD